MAPFLLWFWMFVFYGLKFGLVLGFETNLVCQNGVTLKAKCSDSLQEMAIYGDTINLGCFVLPNGKIQNHCNKSAELKKVSIFALDKIVFDRDVIEEGQLQLYIISPSWEISSFRNITLNGEKRKDYNIGAANGSIDHRDGEDGKPGEDGGHAGNFFGIGKNFVGGNNLTIHANGGDGGSGQDGGNGVDGIWGSSAIIDDNYYLHYQEPCSPPLIPDYTTFVQTYFKNTYGEKELFTMHRTKWPQEKGSLPVPKEFQIIEAKHVLMEKLNLDLQDYLIQLYEILGKPPTPPGKGGNGGRAGNPGKAGSISLYEVCNFENGSKIMKHSTDGKPGKKQGKGGKGGKCAGYGYNTVFYRLCKQRIIYARSEHRLGNQSMCTHEDSGKDGVTANTIVVPKVTMDSKDVIASIKEYEQYMKANLNSGSRKEFLKCIGETEKMMLLYGTLEFLNELQALENDFYKRKEKDDYSRRYEALLFSIGQYSKMKSFTASPQDRKVLRFLYTAILDKINNIKNESKTLSRRGNNLTLKLFQTKNKTEVITDPEISFKYKQAVKKVKNKDKDGSKKENTNKDKKKDDDKDLVPRGLNIPIGNLVAKQKENQKELAKIDESIRSLTENIEQLNKYKETTKNVFSTMLKYKDIKKHLGLYRKEGYVTDLRSWQVKAVLSEVKFMLRKMTEGFESQDILVQLMEKVESVTNLVFKARQRNDAYISYILSHLNAYMQDLNGNILNLVVEIETMQKEWEEDLKELKENREKLIKANLAKAFGDFFGGVLSNIPFLGGVAKQETEVYTDIAVDKPEFKPIPKLKAGIKFANRKLSYLVDVAKSSLKLFLIAELRQEFIGESSYVKDFKGIQQLRDKVQKVIEESKMLSSRGNNLTLRLFQIKNKTKVITDPEISFKFKQAVKKVTNKDKDGSKKENTNKDKKKDDDKDNSTTVPSELTIPIGGGVVAKQKEYAKELEKYDESIRSLTENIDKLNKFENTTKNVFSPMLKNMQNDITRYIYSFQETSAWNDLRLWKVGIVLSNVRFMIRKMTEGFESQDILVHKIANIEDAVNIETKYGKYFSSHETYDIRPEDLNGEILEFVEEVEKLQKEWEKELKELKENREKLKNTNKVKFASDFVGSFLSNIPFVGDFAKQGTDAYTDAFVDKPEFKPIPMLKAGIEFAYEKLSYLVEVEKTSFKLFLDDIFSLAIKDRNKYEPLLTEISNIQEELNNVKDFKDVQQLREKLKNYTEELNTHYPDMRKYNQMGYVVVQNNNTK